MTLIILSSEDNNSYSGWIWTEQLRVRRLSINQRVSNKEIINRCIPYGEFLPRNTAIITFEPDFGHYAQY